MASFFYCSCVAKMNIKCCCVVGVVSGMKIYEC